MWQILKTEFRYTRDALIIAYLITAAFFVIALLRDNYGIYNFMWNTTIIYFIFMGITFSVYVNERRYRFFATLPVTPEEITIVDGLYVLLVQLGMCVFWLLYLVFRPETITSQVLWAMLANSATILSLVTVFGIHYHLGFFEPKYKRVNWLILLAFILTVASLGYLRKLDEVARVVWVHYASGHGALISLLLCTALSVASARIFLRRKSYLA